MSANVFAFPSRSKGPQPWTNDELAELYRVVDLLGRAGLSVVTDMGMSDEGDPWFVFCRADNEEVIAHFARIDGNFVAASIAVDETFRGANFRQIVDRMVSSQPLVVPKPGAGGSRLFLHPAVLLTAFVATALAHSEKMLAQDLVRAVEAQWDHAKAAALSEVKHVKTGWLDTLHTLWKLPLQENKLAHDAVKETQALTLASLIAIAMAALQPIVEKIAIISQIVADEFPGHNGGVAHGQSAHAALLAQDGQVADLVAGAASDHGNGHLHSGEDAPHAAKAVATAADFGGDGQKAMIDSSHAVSVPAVQKAAVAEDAGHVQAHATDAADVNGAFVLLQQKVAVAAMTAAPEVPAFHLDLSANAVQTINVQDVTPEALQLLSIHVGSSDSSSKTAASDPGSQPQTSAPAAGASGSNNESPSTSQGSGTGQGAAVTTVAAAPQPSQTQAVGPQEINTATVSGEQVIDAIANFANSGFHTISQPSAITFSAALQQELSGYFNGASSLKIVIFDTTSQISDVFAFAPGVVFVADKDLAPTSIITNHGGNLTLDVAGGTVTLVGVATIDHAAA